MSAQDWLDGNASLMAAHEKYGVEFEAAQREFRSGFWGAEDYAKRQALWSDYKKRGENVMTWYRQRHA